MTSSSVVEAPDRPCINCGASAPGAYCPSCGQDTRERLPTFVQFMREATGRYVSFEGKLWKTLLALLFRPGFLTREYFAGRRRRYIGPARLFLVSSLLLFAMLGLLSASIDIDNAIIVDNSDAATPKRGVAAGVEIDDNLNVNLDSLPEAMGVLRKRIDRFNHLNRTQKAEQLLGGALRYGPYAMFALLPAFAALLKLVYLGRRQRYPTRPRLYGEHLVFAAHNHAFLFIVATLMFVMPVEIARQAAGLWIFVYLAWSMHAVYRGRWLGIAARAFVLLVAYSTLFSVVTAGLLIAAIVLR